MEEELVKPWTLWKNEKSKRIFLVVDKPFTKADKVVLMEVKEYAPDEARIFNQIPFWDWEVMVDEKGQLKPYVPKLI